MAFLWRGRWLIAAATVLAAAAGVFYAQKRGTIFRARSVLYVERDTPMIPGTDVSLWLRSRNYANTQAALLRSSPILEAALRQPGVDGTPIFGDSKKHVAWMQRNLSVSVGELDDLITVSLDSALVDDACNIVNAVIRSYLDFHSQSKRETAGEVLGHLTSELQRYETELAAVQKEQVEFLTRHPEVNVSKDAAGVAADRFRELNAALTRAEIDMVEAETAYKAAKTLAVSADLVRQLPLQGTVLPPPTLTQEQTLRLHELHQRYEQLLAEATPEHPEVKRLAAAIADLEQATNSSDQRLATAYVTLFEQRYESSKQKHTELAAKVAEQERLIKAADPVLAEYRAIDIRFERARKIADTLYERVRTLDINETTESTRRGELDALIYETASPTSAPVASSKTSLVAMITFLGFLIGVGLAWFRSLLDQRLRSAEDVAGLLPLLATVPRISPDRTDALQTWRQSPEFGEALRSLRTVIYFGVRGARSRTLQFTSAQERDGKSLVTAGLGIAMAQAGNRTLIVDADFHQATQARLFRVPNKVGLLQVLGRRASADAAIVETPVANLHLLPSGPPTETGELLDGARLAAVLQDLTGRYDRILVDSPPLLPVADARIIAAVCDETLLVLRSGKTTRKLVEMAKALVASVAGRVSGAVLNWAPRTPGLEAGSAYPRYGGLAIDGAKPRAESAARTEASVKEASKNA